MTGLLNTRVAAGLVATVALLISGHAQAADTYKIDTVHSAVIYKVKHLNVGNAYGRFNDISGTAIIDEADPTKSSVDVVIKADSIDTASDKRDEHLKGPDFFNVKQFPEITFKSKEVRKSGDKQFDITGDLSLHGVTKPVTAKVDYFGSAKDPKGTQRAGGEAKINIKRSDFGMNYMPSGIGDDVEIIVSIEAIKQ